MATRGAGSFAHRSLRTRCSTTSCPRWGALRTDRTSTGAPSSRCTARTCLFPNSSSSSLLFVCFPGTRTQLAHSWHTAGSDDVKRRATTRGGERRSGRQTTGGRFCRRRGVAVSALRSAQRRPPQKGNATRVADGIDPTTVTRKGASRTRAVPSLNSQSCRARAPSFPPSGVEKAIECLARARVRRMIPVNLSRRDDRARRPPHSSRRRATVEIETRNRTASTNSVLPKVVFIIIRRLLVSSINFEKTKKRFIIS